MILLTWNLNCRTKNIKEQLDAISKYNADVLAFQEVTINSKDLLKACLRKNGYEYILDSFRLSKEQKKLTGKRKYGQIIASKYKLKKRRPDLFDVPWKERILSADIILEDRKIEIHTTHIPPGASNGMKKIEMLAGIFKKLNRNTKKLRILCGDFNTPQFELEDGTIITWDQNVKYTGLSTGDLRRDLIISKAKESEWDKGERDIFEKLKIKNLTDVYRYMHGYKKQEHSWKTPSGRKTGRRFDHIFASRELNVKKCKYDHMVRERGLSDHSAMVAEFDI